MVDGWVGGGGGLIFRLLTVRASRDCLPFLLLRSFVRSSTGRQTHAVLTVRQPPCYPAGFTRTSMK